MISAGRDPERTFPLRSGRSPCIGGRVAGKSAKRLIIIIADPSDNHSTISTLLREANTISCKARPEVNVGAIKQNALSIGRKTSVIRLLIMGRPM